MLNGRGQKENEREKNWLYKRSGIGSGGTVFGRCES